MAFFALACLTIPILIHLFNPSKGKIILIGNIKFIDKAKNLRVTEIRIRQWLLLLLRLAILFLLTLLLADIFYIKDREIENKERIFISNKWIEQSTLKEKEELLLNHSSDSIHLLQPGYLPIKNLLNFVPAKDSNLELDSLIAELSSRSLLSTYNVFYVTDQLEQFAKNRSDILLSQSAPSEISWVVRKSNEKKLLTRNIAVFYDQNRSLDISNLKLSFQTLNSLSNSIEVSYVAISESSSNQAKKLTSNIDWIFWLSDSAVSDNVLESVNAGSLLLKDKSAIHKSNSPTAINIHPFDVLFHHALPNIHNIAGTAVWFNPWGQVALSYQHKGHGKLYQFHSRFSEHWNTLTKDIQFPIIFTKLLTLSKSDQQRIKIATSEVSSISISEKPQVAIVGNSLNSFRSIIIFLLSLLWLLERLLSEKRAASDA